MLFGQIDEGFQVAVDTDNGSIDPWKFESGGTVDDQRYIVGGGVVYSAGPGCRVYALAAPTDLD